MKLEEQIMERALGLWRKKKGGAASAACSVRCAKWNTQFWPAYKNHIAFTQLEGRSLKQPERQIKIHSETLIIVKSVAENDQHMKSYFTLTLLVAGAFLSGCASEQNKVVLDTVGPPLSQPAAKNPNDGTLVVYSAYEVNPDFNARDPDRPEHSDYEIFTPDGKLLQRVHNNSGTILQEPVSIALAAGKYSIKARANGYGLLSIPVVIVPQQNTELHLEGGGFWPNESAFNQTNAVRLPDGQIIGWKSPANL